VHPGGVVGGRGGPLAGGAVGVGGPFAPVGQQPPQLNGLCRGGAHGHVEAEGDAVDGGPGRDVAGDVKGDHATADGKATRGGGTACEEGITGAVADVASGALVEGVVFAGTENDGRGHDSSFKLDDL